MTLDPNGLVPNASLAPGGASPKTAPGKAPEPEAVEAAGAAFRALLERLEKTAKDLDDASASIEDPRQLGEAVKSARASVEQAVLMGSDLLEAYRASQVHKPETHPERPRTGLGETQ